MLKRIAGRSEVNLAGLGFDLAASVAVATALGWWIDHRWGTDPWGLIVCASIGIVGGLLNFVRAGRRAMESRASRDRKGSRGGENDAGSRHMDSES